MIVSAVSLAQPATLGGGATGAASATQNGTAFVDMIDQALRGVSATQNAAGTAEAGYAAGAPGATLGKALVASDRAEVAWNATVAVRNEVVTAYQSIMSMQF